MRVLNRRRRNDRDDELPSRDDVAGQLASDDRAADAGGDDVERLELTAFRPPFAHVVVGVVPMLVVVGLVLFLPYWWTPEGRAQVVERGWLPVVLGWIGMVLIIVLGALLGLGLARIFANGVQRFRRVDVFRLALWHAVVGGAGATLASIFVAGSVADLLRVITIVFFMTVIFTWAALFPRYRRAWDASAGRIEG